MSTFSNDSIGVAISYEHELLEWEAFDKFSINLAVDYIKFDFEDFRDIRSDALVGLEPFYSFDATVTRLFFSIWY